jgi:DNA-binding transcriptional LysR family regulator
MPNAPTIEPNDLLLFAQVVEDGSFSAASQHLGVPKATLSRRLSLLEARLGERLLLRTTRKLTLTEFGHGVLEHARQVAAEARAAAELAQHRQARPSGRLRVSMPSDFANVVLSQLLAEFIAHHPGVTLELDVSPRRVDLIGENFDLAIRMGALGDDASLAARRLAEFSTGLYAAPAYLALRGRPAEPEQLMEHDALRLLRRDRQDHVWTLERDGVHWEGVVPARAIANSPEVLVRLARAGSGIAALADHFALPYVQAGELEAVLPAWRLPSVTAWAVFPGRRLMPARTRAFLDALAAEFTGPRCQQAERSPAAARGLPAHAPV